MVEKGSPGFKAKKIEGKMSLRMVENADIKLNSCFVPNHNKLTYATNFEKSTGAVLLSSRIGVAAGISGLACGAYE